MKYRFSASKTVFILLAVGATVGLFTGHVNENNFMLLATGAFAFYFAKPVPLGNS